MLVTQATLPTQNLSSVTVRCCRRYFFRLAAAAEEAGGSAAGLLRRTWLAGPVSCRNRGYSITFPRTFVKGFLSTYTENIMQPAYSTVLCNHKPFDTQQSLATTPTQISVHFSCSTGWAPTCCWRESGGSSMAACGTRRPSGCCAWGVVRKRRLGRRGRRKPRKRRSRWAAVASRFRLKERLPAS